MTPEQSLLPPLTSLWDEESMGKFLVALQQLESWFIAEKRILPWRNLPSLYRVWISEIMLQQTQVATVIPYFEKFVSRFPDVETLAHADEADVLLHWAGLGYYSRARNLHRGAKKISQNQQFPKTWAEWLEIPGVGPYTAGAILSIALNEPEAILDGNVERVLTRLRKIQRSSGDTFYKNRLWRLAKIFVLSANTHGIPPSHCNQALMELGATICTPRKPQCHRCPMISICRAFMNQEQELFPEKKKRKDWVQVQEELHCIFNASGQVLVEKRNSGQWRAGLWDFLPLLPPEIQKSLKPLGHVETQHIVTRHKIHRKTWIWEIHPSPSSLKTSELFCTTRDSFRWISVADPKTLSVPAGSAFKRTLQNLQTFSRRVSEIDGRVKKKIPLSTQDTQHSS